MAIIAATQAEIFAAMAPWLGLLLPFVVAFVVKAEASTDLKRYITLGLTALVAVLSLVMDDWSMFEWSDLPERLLFTLGQAQAVYVVASLAVARWLDTDSLNELPAFRPDKGIG